MTVDRIAPITLILGAGGARGYAHLGILDRLRAGGVPIGAIIGCSVGGLIGGFFAGLGRTPDQMVGIGMSVTGRALLAHAAAHWSRRRGRGAAAQALLPLHGASFDRLHHGVEALGITAFDLIARRRILCTGRGEHNAVRLAEAVIGGAAIPVLFPPKRVRRDGRHYRLVDAGFLDAVPVEAALDPPFDRGPVVAVDLALQMGWRQHRRHYWDDLAERLDGRLLRLRPRVTRFGTVRLRRRDVPLAVEAGRRAVTPEILDRLRSISATAGIDKGRSDH